MHDQMSMLKSILCAAAVLTTASQALRPAKGDSVDVVVKTIHQDAVAGRLISFSLERGLSLQPAESADQHHVAAAEIVRISRSARSSAPSAGMTTVTLSSGDKVIGMAKGFADDRVVMEVPFIGHVQVPLERVSTWRTSRAAKNSWRPAVEKMLAQPLAGLDVLLMSNGDQVEGIITSIDAEGIVVDTSLGISRINHDRVVAARITSVPAPSDHGLRARIQLVDGTRLTVDSLRWTDAAVAARFLSDEEHYIPPHRVAYVEIIGGRWQWLTELDPISVEQTPMMSVHWPYVRNRNVSGEPLSVAGQSFEHGLGVHSRSLLTFDLQGEYSQFVTSYGVDDDSGSLADVAIMIRTDGQLRHKAESVGAGQLRGPIRIDVTGAGRIELIVDFGKFGGIQDRFDWIEPALIRRQ